MEQDESGGQREEGHSQQDSMGKAQRWENEPDSGRGEVTQLNGARDTSSGAWRPGLGGWGRLRNSPREKQPRISSRGIT